MLELGSLPRQACPDSACGHVFWDNPAPVVAALVEWEGRIILARNQAWAEGKFGLISGFSNGTNRRRRRYAGRWPKNWG